MSAERIWIPAVENPEAWLNRLPRTKVLEDRLAWLVDCARERRVAHVGFADIGCEETSRELDRWAHARLADAASELVGLDVSEPAVLEANAAGYESYSVDCTDEAAVANLRLTPFDVVLLGEVIEHVDNAGGLLRAMHALVKPGGKLVVTTPNARRLVDTVLAAFGRETIHPDHVALYSATTLRRLLHRHGWAVQETLPYLVPRSRGAKTAKERLLRTVSACQRVVARTTSPFLADGLIVVATRRQDAR